MNKRHSRPVFVRLKPRKCIHKTRGRTPRADAHNTKRELHCFPWRKKWSGDMRGGDGFGFKPDPGLPIIAKTNNRRLTLTVSSLRSDLKSKNTARFTLVFDVKNSFPFRAHSTPEPACGNPRKTMEGNVQGLAFGRHENVRTFVLAVNDWKKYHLWPFREPARVMSKQNKKVINNCRRDARH